MTQEVDKKMKTDAKLDAAKTDIPKNDAPKSGAPEIRQQTALPSVRKTIALTDIELDTDNRSISDDDADIVELADTIAVMGVLDPPHVWRRPNGKYKVVDGERRVRAAKKAGLTAIECNVYAEQVSARDLTLAGLIINEQRKAHTCIEIATRLRLVQKQFAETYEGLAERTGLPLARITSYLNLWNSSDRLLEYFETSNVSLALAVELVRYERAFGDVATRRLLAKDAIEPLTVRYVAQLRKRGKSEKPEAASKDDADPPTKARPSRMVASLKGILAKDATSLRQLFTSPGAGLSRTELRTLLDRIAEAVGCQVIDGPPTVSVTTQNTGSPGGA